MKIAIKGHPSRGKEILSLLKSLGSNTTYLSGDGRTYYYYMDENHIVRYGDPPIDYKVYTLEEFEKEFPFKIGDKIKHISSIGIIKEYCYVNNEPAYKVEGIESDIVVIILAKMLEPYKEMKEERNITLTLDKAKEWYNKGGELKEIALQAFSEKELNPLPRSWEEFCKQCNPIASWRYNVPIKYEALYKLEKLRDCWIQGWVQTPTNPGYRINKTVVGDYIVAPAFSFKYFLAFPTKEMAEEFLKCFRDLIKKAGDLI